MFFKRNDHLPALITSYDLVKAATLVFMLIDHVGAYFLPDEPWWRVFGRFGFPVWFILAGYTRNYSIEPKLWAGAGLLIIGNMIFGQYTLPLNALVSFIVIRLAMPRFGEMTFKGAEPLIYAVVALVILSIPTNALFEYGSLVILLGLIGYGMRQRERIPIPAWGLSLYAVVASFAVAGVEAFLFGFNGLQSLVSGIGIVAICCAMFFTFRPAEFPKLTEFFPRPVGGIIRFCGRYTLEIYVFHLLAIKAYLLYADAGVHAFAPTLFPAGKG
jgi:hypothetical protein